MEEIPQIQILGSQASWQQVSHIQVGWWMRPLLVLAVLVMLFFAIFGWTITLIIKLLNILTCGWIRSLHRASQRFSRRMRWLSILTLACFIGIFSPQLALTLVMSYCMVRSFDFPEHWMQWFMRFDGARRNTMGR